MRGPSPISGFNRPALVGDLSGAPPHLENTVLLTFDAPLLGAPVPGLCSGIILPVAQMRMSDHRLQIAIVPFDRLWYRILGPENKVKWSMISTTLRRVGDNLLSVLITEGDTQARMFINGELAWHSGAALPSAAIEIGRGSPPDRTSEYQEDSAKVRRKREQAAARYLERHPGVDHRVLPHLTDRIKLLKEDVAELRVGKSSRTVTVGSILRTLLGDTEGNRLLILAAGFVQVGLPVYCCMPDKKCPRPPEVDAKLRLWTSSSLRTQRDKFHPTEVDFGLWLRKSSWADRLKEYTNEEALREFGNTEASHVNPEEADLFEQIRENFSGHGQTLIRWLVEVSDVCIELCERIILPAYQRKIESRER